MHTIDRFIGEFQTNINSFINNNSKQQLIIAPTGTGKTTAIIEYANLYPNKKIVLLCPFRFLVDNIEKDNPNIACGYGSVFLNNNKTSPFIVTTYDSIEKIEDVDLFAVDEAHLLPSHSSFRGIIPLILQTQTKVVFITATPEVIEDLFPSYNKRDYILEFKIHRPLEEVKIYAQKYNVKQTILDIISNNKYNKNTVLIRINSKRIIDKVMQTYKPTLKDKIACIYSDEDNVLFEGQDEEKINELKKGKISNLDFILCTSVYDVGISFEVDRDIDCYAVSQDNRCMPNAIDMVQLLARVRENTGYKMSLTIIGNYQDYELRSIPLPNFQSKAQLCNELSHRYEQYTKLEMEAYEYVLRKYNIDVTEILDLKFKSYVMMHASRLSDTEIVKNFQNFPKEYEIICNNLNSKNKSSQIKLITGKERINGLKNSANVQRVFNTLFEAVRMGIDFNLFIGERFSEKKFKALEKISSNYKEDTNDIFSNLIRGLAYSKDSTFNFKELGFFELNKNDANTIKTLFNMIYKRGDFRGAKASKNYKKGVNMVLLDYINCIEY
jgi:hypothetical protein